RIRVQPDSLTCRAGRAWTCPRRHDRDPAHAQHALAAVVAPTTRPIPGTLLRPEPEETPVMPALPEHRFGCGDCGTRLVWDPAEIGRVLVCGNPQCPAAGMAVTVAAAQQRRVEAGQDVPAPGPGWSRPRRAGLPVPYLVPVSDGRPWWRLID